VLLRVVRHALRNSIVALLPLSVAMVSRVALAQDSNASPNSDEPVADANGSIGANDDAGVSDANGDNASDTAGASGDSATDKTRTKTQTYQLPPPASRWKTVGLGLGFSGAWYLAAWGIRAGFWSEAPGANDLRYPLVGPWMDLYKTGCPSNDTNCGTFGLVVRTALVVIDGVGQVGGLAVALDGLFTPTASSSKAAGTAHGLSTAPRISLVPVPWSTTGGGGFSFVGQF
jgi:hypothetical protein